MKNLNFLTKLGIMMICFGIAKLIISIILYRKEK